MASSPPPSVMVGRWDLSRALGLQFHFQVWSIAEREREEEEEDERE